MVDGQAVRYRVLGWEIRNFAIRAQGLDIYAIKTLNDLNGGNLELV